MFKLPLDQTIKIQNIENLLKGQDFLDLIHKNLSSQNLGSAQAVCKFLVFEIPNHEIHKESWENISVFKPQVFKFDRKSHNDLIFWQRVECSPMKNKRTSYIQLKTLETFELFFNKFFG